MRVLNNIYQFQSLCKCVCVSSENSLHHHSLSTVCDVSKRSVEIRHSLIPTLNNPSEAIQELSKLVNAVHCQQPAVHSVTVQADTT